jgi:hypothetical protein
MIDSMRYDHKFEAPCADTSQGRAVHQNRPPAPGEFITMNWLQIGLIGSVIFALYYIQQIKMTLKEKGLDVEMFSGWLSDYKRFKALIVNEKDERQKIRLQGILNGLHLALAGLVVIAYFLFSQHWRS